MTPTMNVWCVRHTTGWCAAKNQPKKFRYSDTIKTACGFVVILTSGIERREPDCHECRAVMGEKERTP